MTTSVHGPPQALLPVRTNPPVSAYVGMLDAMHGNDRAQIPTIMAARVRIPGRGPQLSCHVLRLKTLYLARSDVQLRVTYLKLLSLLRKVLGCRDSRPSPR